jgi:hypothetical protein
VDTNSIRPKLGDFIQIDYEKSLREAYMDAVLYLIELRGSFDVLAHVEDVPLGHQRYDLPSWVPDWTSPQIPSEVTRHVMEPSPERFIELFHIGIRSAGVLGCIGYTVGVIEEILDGTPPCVDAGTLCEQIIAELSFLANSTYLPDCQQLVDQIQWLAMRGRGLKQEIDDAVVKILRKKLSLWLR